MMKPIWLVLAIVFAVLGSASQGLAQGGLIDHRGQPISEAQFAPEFRLVYFGYTHCPDACPLALQTMSDAIDGLGRLGERVTPVFITIDPERDVAQLLKGYIEMFHPRMIAVTGAAGAIAEIAGRYKVTYGKAPGSSEPAYSMDHSTSIYLTTPSGQILGRFPHDIAPRALGTRIVKSLMQAQ